MPVCGADAHNTAVRPLAPEKFQHPLHTATHSPRAYVDLVHLSTLWINTGTLCNQACQNCYIESSPRNDRLAYFPRLVAQQMYVDLHMVGHPTTQIGFTGGEPFMNPDFIGMMLDAINAGFDVLVLTNATRPLQTKLAATRKVVEYARGLGRALVFRVSLDHYTPAGHDAQRGAGSWDATTAGIKALLDMGAVVHIAGRQLSGETQSVLIAGYQAVFDALGIDIRADDPRVCVIFPEMDATQDVPEITTDCWDILNKSPKAMMCSSSRMVVLRKGAKVPDVLACTLLPYAPAFSMGQSVKNMKTRVYLNHPHCAKFCVLGGAQCSS
jgi:hypothetical protein